MSALGAAAIDGSCSVLRATSLVRVDCVCQSFLSRFRLYVDLFIYEFQTTICDPTFLIICRGGCSD